MRPIFLLTDFGRDDAYVAQMHAVLHRAHEAAIVVDLSHGIEKFNVRQAAYRLSTVVPYLPNNAIVVAVVDPGVGTNRRALILRDNNRMFVGPDNGIFSWINDSMHTVSAWCIPRSDSDESISHTFHGRDLFCPVASQLSLGADPDRVADRLDNQSLILFPSPTFESLGANRIRCPLIDVDSFGNMVFALRPKDLPATWSLRTCSVEVHTDVICPISQTYADVVPGELVCLFNSNALLELARREASARELLPSLMSIDVVHRVNDDALVSSN